MKKITRLFIVIFILAISLAACELLGDCKTCYLVTYEDGVETNRTTGIEYCGDELADIESEPPVTVGNRTTQYECE